MTVSIGVDVGSGVIKTTLFRVDGEKTEWLSRWDARIRQRNAFSLVEESMHSVLIYVEGTRSKDGKLQPLKKGGFHIALQSGLPIVPVRITGSHDIVPSGSLRVRPGRVVVELFDPIPTEGKTEADVPELMARVRDALLS